jgi:isoquinoline 1-oxidoreductase subunit beta
MSRIGTIARRGFLLGSVAVLGGVAFGWWRYATPYGNPLTPTLTEGETTLNAYVIIDAAGVTIIAPRAEMGQGVHTTLAAMVAEEMDLTLDQVRVVHGPASNAYFNAAGLAEGLPFMPTDRGWLAETSRAAVEVPAKFLGLQMTGGSSSVPDAFEKMRLAGAAARIALVAAAAERLGVGAETLSTREGAVIARDGTEIPYTELAEAAALVKISGEPALKDRSEWTLLGKTQPRVDMPGKVTGTAMFTADLRLPGMVFATVKANPNLGAEMLSFEDSAATAMPGFIRTVSVARGVAVVASSTWAAMQAAEEIAFEWAPATYPQTTERMEAEVAASFVADRRDGRPRNEGDVEAVLAADAFEAEYSVPFLAHATMEPMTAAALLMDGQLTIWAGNQIPTLVRDLGAELTGLPKESIHVETMLMGGGFGRRLESDMIAQVVTVAKAMEGTPVLLTWSREEDMMHGMLRPMAKARVRGKVDAGKVAALDYSVAAPSVLESFAGRMGYSIPGPDGTLLQGGWEQPYGFPNYRVTAYRVPAMVPVGNWRSVGASFNGFFHDTAIDELAHLAGVDPVEFRLSQLTDMPSRKVIEAVAEMSDWGNVPASRARGVAFTLAFGVPAAEVIEVEQTDRGIRMTNAWAAVDVGIALDPGNIAAQVSGAMVFGLSAAIRGKISFADGQVQEWNFWDYEPLRLDQCPPVEVRVLENGDRIRGIGEPGTPPAAPALGNAIFALTGQRLRDLPFADKVDFA